MPSADQGTHSKRYSLIPRTLIFINRGDKFLLLRGAAEKRLWANLYNGLGGHVERGEDVLSAARRELVEETGLVVDQLWLCGVVTVDTGLETGVAIFLFRGESLTGEPIPSTEGTLEWIEQDRIGQLPLVEDLFTLLPRLLATRRGDPPFYAHYWYDKGDRLMIRFTE